MLAPRLFAVALFGLGMTGCASLESSPIKTTAVPVAAPPPPPVAGYDWFYHVQDDEARLAYGLEASDDLRLGLSCDRGSRKLELTAVGPRGLREIHVESGGETERFAARGEPSDLHDGDFLTAEAATSAPVFQRFRRLGWLALRQGGRREAYAPHPGAAGDIERFFGFCG